MSHLDDLTLEHIDPREGHLICGLENEFNEIIVEHSYNARKTNRFVPYRVCEHNAPVTFGDYAEFLIEGEWVVCEFGGDAWWAESNRIGNSQTVGGQAAAVLIRSLTPEQRSERSRKGAASLTPGQRRERSRKAAASRTFEQRSESARKGVTSRTFEQRSESAQKAIASQTSEQLSERARKGRASMTPEQRSEITRKGNATRKANAEKRAREESDGFPHYG